MNDDRSLVEALNNSVVFQDYARAFTEATGLLPEEARTLLAKFGLKAGHVDRPARSLSPGERTRVSLAQLQATCAPRKCSRRPCAPSTAPS